jgi:glycosyltransferase involved in cell wall biosynthesis
VRIALVSRELYPYVGGGIAPIVAQTARTLARVAEVIVFTSADHREYHERLAAVGDERLLPAAVRVVFVDEPASDDIGAAYTYMHAYSARVHFALRETYGDRGPDLIEFPDYLGEGFVTIQDRHTDAPWLRNTLVCVRLHTSSEITSILDGRVSDEFGARAMFELERYSLRHADRVLWSGGDVLGTYQRLYGEDALAPACKIPDALLEEPSGAAGRREPLTDDRPLRLLYLGRMERRKGVQNLVNALQRLDRRDWCLTLLGADTDTGPLGTSLRTVLEVGIGKNDRFKFADPIPRAQVGAVIEDHDVVVVPSLWECWPNVVREALSHNRPVLATPVGGLTEMVQPGRSGWLTRDTSTDGILEAIRDLLTRRSEVEALIDDGKPKEVVTELANSERLLREYQELVAEGRPPRPRRRPRSRLVTVVVPYFRLEDYVGETLASIEAQTHRDLEIIIVNDGSLREEDAVVFDLASELPLRHITQPNSGLGAARNLGISQALGEYVLPLDADDVISPTFVARCLDALDADADLAYVTTWAQFMDANGDPFGDELAGYLPIGNWSTLIDTANVGGTCSSVFRRRVFDRGFRYSPELTSYEDWLLYWELHLAGLHGAIIPERLFQYRVRERSMMREVGAPRTGTLVEEIRAHIRERSMQWTAG